MVDINITLVIQALHFLLMWWVLDRFFFRYVVKIVQKEDAQLDKLNTSIAKEHAVLATEQERQEKQWQRFKKRFGKQAPELESTTDLSFTPVTYPSLRAMTKDHKADLLKETKILVIKKVLENE